MEQERQPAFPMPYTGWLSSADWFLSLLPGGHCSYILLQVFIIAIISLVASLCH